MIIKEIKNGAVIHCKTQEEADKLCDEVGAEKRWKDYWNMYESNTCYEISQKGMLCYGKMESFKGEDIINFSELIITDTIQSMHDAYNRGLNAAWELARKISLHVTDGGVDMSPSELRTVFDIEPIADPTYCILRDYKAEEVINRLKSYEDNKIEVGDIVFNDDTMEEGVVTYVGDGQIFMLYADGSCGRAEGRLTKTGKKCDVGDFLAEIGKE